MKIKRLSDKLINLIAAGEVIERPSSVVKELVENSLDAGASEIEVCIENGGKNFISISDNGSGINKEQVELAFERHATSKIDEDIFNINFFGFRGEALPSIASVCKVEVESNCDKVQYKATFENGNLKRIESSNRKYGTKVTASDLFANIPVRLKFLKSERSEIISCTNLIKKIALANPNVGLKLYSDGNLILDYHISDSEDRRIADVIGEDFIENSIPIFFENERIKFHGRVSYPTLNAGTSHFIHNFVNKRTVYDKLLTQIVRNAYVNLTPAGKYPKSVLFFEFPKSEVDVNVHPTKQEIRLVDGNYFKSLIQTQIRNKLKHHHLQNNTQAEESLRDSFAKENVSYKTFSKPLSSKVNFKRDDLGFKSNTHSYNYKEPAVKKYNEMHERISKYDSTKFDAAHTFEEKFLNPQKTNPNEHSAIKDDKSVSTEFENKNNNINHIAEAHPLGYAKCQIAGSYIIAENGDDMIIIDQHAAHERINLENFKKELKKKEAQTLAIPIVVKLLSQEEADHVMEKKSLFENYGISFERNGSSEIMVRQINKLIPETEVEDLILKFAHHELEDLQHVEDKLIFILGNIACKKSIKAGKIMSIEEMNGLLRRMEKTQHASNCNHGRPTYITLSKDKLAKLFERS